MFKKQKLPILLEIIEDQDVEAEQYTEMRRPYTNCEFIPSNIIPIVMKHFFNSSELLMSFNENHGIYKIMVGDLLVSFIKNWEYNRPPDMARCPDIARYIYNSKKPLDTMIHLSFNNIKEVFEVIDGIHRITALKLIKEQNSKPLDLLETHVFGSGNDAQWLFNQYMLVNIRFNASLGDLIETFKNLNKSQVVPELYIRDHGKEKRIIIDSIANEWFVKYKKHFSSSNNPITGNTNRNKFVELLDKLYDKHHIDDSNADELKTILNEANDAISRAIPIRVTTDTRLKCKESGCYLFLYKNDVLQRMI